MEVVIKMSRDDFQSREDLGFTSGPYDYSPPGGLRFDSGEKPFIYDPRFEIEASKIVSSTSNEYEKRSPNLKMLVGSSQTNHSRDSSKTEYSARDNGRELSSQFGATRSSYGSSPVGDLETGFKRFSVGEDLSSYDLGIDRKFFPYKSSASEYTDNSVGNNSPNTSYSTIGESNGSYPTMGETSKNPLGYDGDQGSYINH